MMYAMCSRLYISRLQSVNLFHTFVVLLISMGSICPVLCEKNMLQGSVVVVVMMVVVIVNCVWLFFILYASLLPCCCFLL